MVNSGQEMTFIFTAIIVFIAALYYGLILFYYLGLNRLAPGKNSDQPPIVIIVPARNEEKNISNCLESLLNQNYPRDLYQIHVVDDSSEDNTAGIVKAYEQKFPGRIFLHTLTQESHQNAYKKRAIQYGIEHSDSDLIFTIDGDCRAQPTWLASMVRYFEDDVGMIGGYVVLMAEEGAPLFHHLQSIEFLGIITASAGSLGMGFPATSNGANLAYRRKVFEEVDGFQGIEQLPSGDDDLLMHKIHGATRWKIRFAFEKDAVVFTNPEPTLRQFLNQRTRWASKSTHYTDKKITLVLALIYFFYLYLFCGIIYATVFHFTLLTPILFSGKCLVEFLVMNKACRVVGRKNLLNYFLLAQFFQIFYILIAGFRGVFGKYNWKGRETQNYIGLHHSSKINR